MTIRNKGFTLIEILIAIFIFSIIIFALFSSFNAFLISSKSIKENIIQIEKIQDVFKRISLDLELLYVLQTPRYEKPGFDSEPDPYRLIGEQVNIGQNVISSMSFTSCAHAITDLDQRAGVARIAYYLRENQNNSYDLFRSDSLHPFPEEQESCLDPVLCKNISGFEIVYRDINGDEHSFWDSDAKEFNYTFPENISLKISFGTQENRKIFDFSFTLSSGRPSIE